MVRHHRVPRTKLYIPDEQTFPIPVKYVDVTRWTETDLDEIALGQINDLRVDVREKDLGQRWTGKIVFRLIRPKPEPGMVWAGEKQIRERDTTRSSHFNTPYLSPPPKRNPK